MPNMLAITFFERPCQVYFYLQVTLSPPVSSISFRFSIQAFYGMISSVYQWLIFFCSQELLVAVEAEKCLRSRNNYSSSLTNSSVPFERFNGDHVSELIVS